MLKDNIVQTSIVKNMNGDQIVGILNDFAVC